MPPAFLHIPNRRNHLVHPMGYSAAEARGCDTTCMGCKVQMVQTQWERQAAVQLGYWAYDLRWGMQLYTGPRQRGQREEGKRGDRRYCCEGQSGNRRRT